MYALGPNNPICKTQDMQTSSRSWGSTEDLWHVMTFKDGVRHIMTFKRGVVSCDLKGRGGACHTF